MKTVPWILITLLCLGFSSSGAVAETSKGFSAAGGDPDIVSRDFGPEKYYSAAAIFHAFTGEEMKDTYGQMYGACFQGGQLFTSGAAWRIESGLLIATGDPIFPDSTWEVGSSSMEMAVIPVGGSLLYQFSKAESERAFVPYIGLGLDGYFGYERTSVKISRVPEGEFDWNDTQYRSTWGGHAFVGATIRLTDKVRGLLEIRWTQGAEGSGVEQSFSQDEINEGWLEVAKAVQRPDFNFTGLSVSIGARW